MLRAGSRHDLNLRGAFVHAATDVVGSAGAALAGLIVMLTGWEYADPLIGAAIGVVVLVSSWGLIRESLRILLEVAPEECDPEEIGQTLASAGRRQGGARPTRLDDHQRIPCPLRPHRRAARHRPRPTPPPPPRNCYVTAST